MIEFVRAAPDPGATIIGCGADLRGCAGQLAVWVRLLSRIGGPVPSITATLHGQNKAACLLATSPPANLQANSYTEVQLRFTTVDLSPLCATPWNATDLAVLSNGTGPTTMGRQEFSIHYRFER